MKIRKSFVLSLNEGFEEEYYNRHNPIWPELAAIFKEHGVQSYSIFLHPETRQLFCYAEIEDLERWDAIAQRDVCRRWWNYMAAIMPSNEDSNPISTPLKEVFHFNNVE